MKKILLFYFLFSSLFTGTSFSQDKIITRNNEELSVNILEQNDKEVKFNRTDFPEKTIFSMRLNRIKKIEYSNGVSDPLLNINPRFKRPFGINFGTAIMLSDEGGMFNLNAEYFVIPQISVEGDIGSDFESFYFAAGAKFHANRRYTRSGFTPFIGLLFGTWYDYAIAQIPLGVNYMAPFGLNVSLSLNEMFYFKLPNYRETYFELKLGWHF